MIRLVTDSGASLPPEFFEQHEIVFIKGRIDFGDEVLLHSPLELTTAEFFRRVAESETLPIQRDSTLQDFQNAFRTALDGKPSGEVISIHPSEVLATTITTARMAVNFFPAAKIVLIDSNSVSVGQGLMVHETARLIRSGRTLHEIVQYLNHMREHLEVFILVDTLDNLAKSGRVGSLARLVGGLLDVKPILVLKDGQVQAHARHRRRERGLDALKTLAIQACKGKENVRLVVGHAVCEDEAQQLADELREIIKPEHLLFTEIGPTVGVHTGPRSMAVGWYIPQEPESDSAN